MKIRITVGSEANPLTREVDADVCGAWAVHESLNGSGWRVTDVSSGRAIPTTMIDGLSHAEASMLALHLNDRIGSAPSIASVCSIGHDEWPYAFDALLAEAFDLEVIDAARRRDRPCPAGERAKQRDERRAGR